MYRGGAEQKIRQYLIDNNYVDCVIQLPDNLFYGTSIATYIMVLKKSKKDSKTLFIDASKECVKVTNNNKLTEENISNILALFESRETSQYKSIVVLIGKSLIHPQRILDKIAITNRFTWQIIFLKKLSLQTGILS